MAIGDKKPVLLQEDIGQESGVPPYLHASQHAADGADPITPDMIGAASNPNLLDNWYFADPINQRGDTTWSGLTYTIDRWRANGSGAQSIVLSDEGLVMTSTTSIGRFLRQVVNNAPTGQEYAFSALIYCDTAATVSLRYNSGNVIKTESVDAGWNLVTGVIPESATLSDVLIRPGTLDVPVTIKAAKLESGSVQTLAHRDEDGNWVLNDPLPNKGLELLKCVSSTADSADTYANSGFVNKAGDTMTGNLVVSNSAPVISAIDTGNNAQAALWQGGNQTVLSNRNVAGSITNQRSLVINNSTQSTGLDYALRLYTTDDGTSAWYNILHTGNKPSGSYTGNGDATARTIETGGIGNVVEIHSSKGSAIVNAVNGLCYSSAGVAAVASTEAKMVSGVITLATTNEKLNASGVTYYYQVL